GIANEYFRPRGEGVIPWRGPVWCRKFVELRGRRIWVKSQVGEGSTFTFAIPVRSPGSRLAAPLLREPGGTASTVVPRPALLTLTPVPFMSLFAPLAAVVLFPARWRITTIFPPSGRGDSVIVHRNLKNRGRNAHGWDTRPQSIPTRAYVPAAVLKCPVLMAIEEYVGGSARRIVDGQAGNHHERRRCRQVNPYIDPYLCMDTHRYECH